LTVLPRVSEPGSRGQSIDHHRKRLQQHVKKRSLEDDDSKQGNEHLDDLSLLDDADDDRGSDSGEEPAPGKGGVGRSLVQQISDIFFKHKAKFQGGNGGGGNYTDEEDIYGDLSAEEQEIMKQAHHMIQDLLREIDREEFSLDGDTNKSHVVFFRIQRPGGAQGASGGQSSGLPGLPQGMPFRNFGGDTGASEIQVLQRRLEEANLPPEAVQVAQQELKHLQRMSPQNPEYSTLVDYLGWIADLPWSSASEDKLVISEARNQLDSDHFGMELIKKRILEHLSVGKLTGDLTGTILCLHGPPGIGKTSLGRSVAKALNRSFHRIALGGVHHEAEVRGHRRTYVSSMPGVIIQALKKCGTNNCVIMLDEIDKLGRHSANGDPYAALLEVLDPEQNQAYRDHYINIPFNLSRVLFLTTANELEPIPRPLRDRMEIIEMSGYTVQEKIEIALRHLLPKQMEKHGLKESDIELAAPVVDALISGYTLEAGVRELERKLAALCRAVSVQIVENIEREAANIPCERESHNNGSHDEYSSIVHTTTGAGDEHSWTGGVLHKENLDDVLGPPKYDGPRDNVHRVSKPGIAIGLAYTPVGGDILFVEAATMEGKGELTITGKLGDVMVESVKIATGWVRAHAKELGIRPEGGALLNRTDLHIHFPAGAMPKDGPSAGVTITTAIVSLLTGRLVRPDLAMTGEMTLRGIVLPVGGIKEKLIAAHRAGMKQVLVPEKNEKDLRELPASVDLNITLVKDINDVLHAALLHSDEIRDATASVEDLDSELLLGNLDAGGSGVEPEYPEINPLPGGMLIDTVGGRELH